MTRLRQRAGITLVELILYLGLSSIVVLSLSVFLTNMFATRAIAVAQTSAQTNARSILERLTLVMRNGYLLQVSGSTLTVRSHPSTDPTATMYTIFRRSGSQLLMGSGPDLTSVSWQAMTGEDIQIISFTPTLMTSAVDIRLEVQQGKRRAALQSTIAFRQTP